MSRPPRKWRLDVRRALILAAVVAVAVPGFLAARALQNRQGRSALLAQAEALAGGDKPDLALHYLDSYLEGNPGDVRALELRAELLADGARAPGHVLDAIKAGEQVLRADPAGRHEATLRRLADLHLRLAQAAPELAQLQTAGQVVDRLLALAPDDPAALRLRARVLEARGLAGDAAALKEAAAGYERALKADPKDVEAAERLAALYAERLGDPGGAGRVLGALVAASPTAPAYLAVHRRYAESDDPADAARAEAALEKAVALAGDDPDVRLAAAEGALRLGRPDEARAHLDRLPEGRRGDVRARFLRGMIDLQANRTDAAIDDWRRGLLAAGGNDIELTYRLAFVLLQLGRVDEAAPLIRQVRRLGGERPTPAFEFLDALARFKANDPRAAIATLERLRRNAERPFQPAQVNYALGQCYEATRDEAEALAAYRRAAKDSPRWPAPALALTRLLQARGDQAGAAAELNRALATMPDDPGLLTAKAREELEAQLRRRRDGRPADWSALEALLARARKAAPGSSAVAALESDYLAATERADEALARLEKATEADPHGAEGWVAYARRLAQLGRTDRALAALDRAAAPENAGDQAALRIARARLLTQLGRGRQAREELVRDLDRLPTDQRPLAWQELGNLHVAQGDRAEARKAYGEWARLAADDPAPRLVLLELALADGDEDAVRAALDALRGIGSAQDLHYRAARTMVLLRPRKAGEADAAYDARLDEASTLIDEIRKAAPEQRFAYVLRGRYHEARLEGEYDERPDAARDAVDAYERALQHDGGAEAIQRLVVLYTRLRRHADLARLRRDHPDLAANIGRYEAEIAARVGDAEQAARLANLLAEADPDDPQVRLWQARIFSSLDRPDEAERILRDLIEAHRDEPGPWLGLLFFQVGRGQADAARATADQIRAAVTKVDRPELFYAQCYRLAGAVERADALYEAALARWPDDPGVARAAAAYYEATRRDDRARACLAGILGRDPSQRWAARALALFLAARAAEPGDWQKAWDLLGPESAEETAEDRLARAIVLGNAHDPGRRDQAAPILEALLKDLPAALPTAAGARNALAQIYLKGGQAARAAELLRVGAEGAGAEPPTVAQYADALIQAGRWDDAAAQVDRLAALTPNDPLVPRLRASLQHRSGHPDEAARTLEEAYRARRDKADGAAFGREVVDQLLRLGRLGEAESVARSMAEKAPDAAVLLAAVKARQGDAPAALQLYRKAVDGAAAPALLEAAQNAAVLATQHPGDAAVVADAEAILRAALERAPDHPGLLSRLGYIRHFQGRFDEEADCYRRAVERRPEDYAFLNNLAWCLSEGLHRPDEALARINDAFRLTRTRYPQFLDTRGVIYTRLGRTAEAIADLEEATRLTKSPVSYAHLARAYHKAGDEARSKQALEAARAAGLTPESLDVTERTDEEFRRLLFAGP